MTQHSSWDFGFESLNAIYTLFSFFICVLLLALRFVKHCFFLLFFLCFCRNWSQLIQRAGGETCLCWDTLNTSWFVHLTSRLFWKTELEERLLDSPVILFNAVDQFVRKCSCVLSQMENSERMNEIYLYCMLKEICLNLFNVFSR